MNKVKQKKLNNRIKHYYKINRINYNNKFRYQIPKYYLLKRMVKYKN